MIKIRDLIAAEEALEDVEEEFRRLSRGPSTWSAFESMDKRGRRTSNVTAADFERRSAAQERVQAARLQLAKRAFLAGVLEEGAGHAAL